MTEETNTLKERIADLETQIEELKRMNEEYKRVILQMRLGNDYFEEDNSNNNEIESEQGHTLLGEHEKILVIGGQELGKNIMQGIAKSFGFKKDDFEFVDYDKAKNYFNRIRKDGRYCAIVFGACPHKTSGDNDYSSALEKFKQTEGMPYAVDARNKSGKLKVTKCSFRTALTEVYDNLRLQNAC